MGLEGGRAWSLIVVALLASVAWTPLLAESGQETELTQEENEPRQTVHIDNQFATSNGFTHINLTHSSTTGVTELERPPISWTGTSGMGLSQLRTGACSAYIPSTNEVLLFGGRVDVDPSQTGDEANTGSVDVFDVTNKTWNPAVEQMKEEQQYHGCAVVGDKVYAIGDHHPFSNPPIEATGLVQVYDASSGNWSYGTSMPGNQSVGLAGVASQGGMIYVAGGVVSQDLLDSTKRLLRYDPVNDTWTQLADMNNRRHSFDLVSFRGKLIAYGGVAVFFDPIANTTVEEETNLTEAYDPVTNSWTQLPNATHKFSAYSAEVFNDEIIVHGGYESAGWMSSANDKTYGYDPFVNRWTTHATLPIGLYDSTLAIANETLVFAGGDSSNSRFSTWSINYLAANEYHTNPENHDGFLTSSILDLRPSADGAASLLWLDFTAIEPNGTTLGLQYRTADSMQNIAASSWLPTSVPVNTYVSAGNHTLEGVLEDTPFLQYRVRYSTDRLMEWVTPTLVDVSIGADSVAFETPPPTTMQPTSAPVSITTHHHSTMTAGDYVLALHPTDAFGSFDAASSWLTMTWNATTATLIVDDPDTMLFSQPHAVAGALTANGQTMNWTFSLNGALPTDHVRFKISTLGLRNSTYLSPVSTTIDRMVTVSLENVTSPFSSQDGDEVTEGEVLPGNTELNLTLDHVFTNSGLRLLGGTIQCRIHLDVETYDLDAVGHRVWSNTSTEWFNLPSGQPYHALINTPEALSGEASLHIEARTSEDWVLAFDTTPREFVVNGAGPILLDVSPDLDEYTNEEPYRTVSFMFYDVGGFTADTLSASVWLEGIDDGSNDGIADGVPQRSEYRPWPLYTHQNGNEWTVNVTVNDTVNDDHQWAYVLLEGTDVAGYEIPNAPADTGHARWESRTPSKGELVSFEPTTNLLNQSLMRFEPSQNIGWALTVVDTNGLTDLTEVRIELGNDEQLGLRYTTVDGVCSSLDERLQLLPDGCEVSVANGRLTVEFTATVQWSMTLAGLAQGELDVLIKDYDGTARSSFTGAWVLDRGMSIEVDGLRDESGPVQQDIESTSVVMGGDALRLTADVAYRSSQTPYSGDLRLRWDGLLQGEAWRGGATVSIVEGVLETTIPTPEESGLVQDMTLTLWDPLETEVLTQVDLPVFMMDNQPPVVLPSAIQNTISRYDLDAVEIGVNIAEPQGWSSPLTLNCQIRSFDQTWDTVQLTRNSTTVFDGKTMFSFLFDLSQMGDPSTLSEQADLTCWAEGADDAGWDLISSTGNSELDPWLEAPLNNIGPDLALENVELTGTFDAGETVRLSFFVTNAGEQLPTPFNTTIELVQGDERTLVGRANFASMDANTAKSVKRSFTAPEGDWSIEITLDQENAVWEIDETNNVWNRTVSGQTSGLGSLTLALGGLGSVVLLAVVVLLRRRKPGGEKATLIVAAMEATGQPPAAVSETPHPSSTKKRGPPGAKIAKNTAKTPQRGPPRGPPKTAVPEMSPQERAAQAMAALGVPSNAEERVEDYSKLPGGGEYEYTADATYYVGPTCGRWRLNDDKSFTRLKDDA